MAKKSLTVDVLTAARERISYVFNTFPRICLSFSGGKDSSVLFHLMMEEAMKRNRKIGVMFIDWEIQFNYTIEHIRHMLELYKDYIIPYWITLPLKTENCVSMFEPEWICWEEGKNWVRETPENSIKDYKYFDFYKYGMTFEEFVPAFGKWYGDCNLTAIIVGIRAGESLNRYHTVTNNSKSMFEDKAYTTWMGKGVYNVYPIYDWQTQDIWIYNGKFKKPYNHLYDIMYAAGVPLHNMRVDEPFGEKQRRGLWLYHIIEPDTWGKVVARVNGANSGALYVQESGNIMGNLKITKPENHTWESFAMMLLESMPEKTSDHYKDKIAIYLHWYQDRGYPNGIPDTQEGDTGPKDDKPSWRRICKVILRNDYWCKALSFSVQKSAYYENYKKIMKKRRETWGIF
jgi:predicted phosphoadenosine phosphosulfate sulfurtransferase